MTTPVEVAVGTIPTLVGTVPAGGQIYMRVEGTQPVTVSNAANASSNLVVGGGTVLAAPTAPGNGGSITQVYAPSTGGADTTEWYAIAPSASVLLVEVSAVPSGGGGGAGITGESLQFGSSGVTLTDTYNGELLQATASGGVISFTAPTSVSQAKWMSVDPNSFTYSVNAASAPGTGVTAVWASGGTPSYSTAVPDAFWCVPVYGLGYWLVFPSAEVLSGYMPLATYDPTALVNGQVAGQDTVQTLTNKRITKRVFALAAPTGAGTVTIDTDTTDVSLIGTATAGVNGALTIDSAGTPEDGDDLLVRIVDNGTAQTLTWGPTFASGNGGSGTVALPTSTLGSTAKTLRVGFEYDAARSAFVCMGDA